MGELSGGGEKKGKCWGSPVHVKVAVSLSPCQDMCAWHSWAEGNLCGLRHCPALLSNGAVLRRRESTMLWAGTKVLPMQGDLFPWSQHYGMGPLSLHITVLWFPLLEVETKSDINSPLKMHPKQV